MIFPLRLSQWAALRHPSMVQTKGFPGCVDNGERKRHRANSSGTSWNLLLPYFCGGSGGDVGAVVCQTRGKLYGRFCAMNPRGCKLCQGVCQERSEGQHVEDNPIVSKLSHYKCGDRRRGRKPHPLQSEGDTCSRLASDE